MDAKKLDRLERLLERELSLEEKERLRRIKDILEIADHDALWDVLTAMEYQRKYYDELPEKISGATAEIFSGLSLAVENEVALAQGRLAENVVKQAENLSLKTHVHTWLLWGAVALVLMLLYGSLLLWAGYCLGSGQTHPPAFLQVPVGLVLGTMCLCGGIGCGLVVAKDYAEGKKLWFKRYLFALACILIGACLFVLSVF